MPAETLPPGDRRDHRIGKYEILSHLGAGGMGAVYRARDVELGREVALKVLPPDLSGRPALLERFRREARHGARLRHENIVTLYEFGEINGTFFLAMELVEGEDLHERVTRKSPLGPREARHLLKQLARALDYTYRQGIVHRDIKPANVLLTEQDGRPLAKLIDLGLALEASDDEFRVTRDGSTVGTVDYMAPEQARDSRAVDVRSDIYSLGCTAFFMLTGRPPFNEGSLTERIFKHQEADPPDVRKLNRQVPDGLWLVLRRMLAKNPAERYQTPAELLQALRSIGRSGETAPPEPPPSQEVNPPRRKKPAAAPLSPETAFNLPAPPPATPPVAGLDVPPATVTDEAPSLVSPPSDEQRRVAAGQFSHGHQAVAGGHPEYGIRLLLSCCKLEPGNLLYRQTLRRAQKDAAAKHPSSKWFSCLTTLPTRFRLQAARKGKDHQKVLEYGEEVLTRNPEDSRTQLYMAEAAEELGLVALAMWILEEAHTSDADNPALNRALARLYEQRQHFSGAIALWELVRKAEPTDGEAHRKVADLAARETIARGRYSEQVERRGRRR